MTTFLLFRGGSPTEPFPIEVSEFTLYARPKHLTLNPTTVGQWRIVDSCSSILPGVVRLIDSSAMSASCQFGDV